MVNALRHADPGPQLTQAEYNANIAHVVDGGVIGDTLYYDGIELRALPLGSAGQVLGVNPGVGPIWTAAPVFGGTLNVEVASSIALTVSRGAGITDYAFQVNTLAASAATGIKITSQAAASGVAISVLSSGTNENVTFDAKGSGTVTISNTSTGNIVLARAVTASLGIIVTTGGLRVSAGTIGLGIAPDASAFISNNAATGIVSGVSQYGFLNSPTFSNAATTQMIGYYVAIRTTAASYTTTVVSQIQVDDVSKGAGHTITTQRGIYVNSQTKGGTNNYGIYIEAPSGGATANIALYNAGTTTLVGAVTTNAAITVTTGDISLTNGKVLLASGGSLASPAIRINGDTNTGWYATLANHWSFSSAGVLTVHIGSASEIVAGGLKITAGNVGIGVAPTSANGLRMSGTSVTGDNQNIIDIRNTIPSAAVTSASGLFISQATVASAFTLVTYKAIDLLGPSLGAGSAITTANGLYVRNFGAGSITHAYGVYIEAQSGAATTNIGLYNGGTTTLIGITTLSNKIYPGTDAAAAQAVCGIYAGTGAPNNANGANGDVYFNAAGAALTTIYQRRAGTWVGII